MEGVGAEVSQKIRSAIKAKLMEIGVYVDEELPDYVMVMVANKRNKEQMDDDLNLFLGQHTSLFTTWLHQVLQKLKEVSVTNSSVKKRKLLDDPKKKKKSKKGGEIKELKNKIKIEPEDNIEQPVMKTKETDNIEHTGLVKEDSISTSSIQITNEINSTKEKEKVNHEEKVPSSSEVCKQQEEKATSKSENKKITNIESDGRRNSQSASIHTEDLDDEDCINIRTDGELLYTAEEMNAEEPTKGQKEKKASKDSKTISKVLSLGDQKQRTTLPIPPKSRKSLSKSRSKSPLQRRKTHSRSPVRRRKTLSRSPARRRRTPSRSPLRRRRTHSRSPVRRRRTHSRSPVRRRRTHSRSPVRRRRTPSRSPSRRRRTLSRSPSRRHRTSSRSPRRKSRSPSRRHKTSSRSPQRRRSRSQSIRRFGSPSTSPNRRCRTRTRSPIRRKISSQSPQRRNTSSKSPTQALSSNLLKQKNKTKSLDNKNGKTSGKEAAQRSSPSKNLLDDKVIDARELLNRKKAARELGNRNTSRSRSKSPVQKRRDDKDSNYRSHRDDKDADRRTTKGNELSSKRLTRDEDRDRRNARDLNLSKRREDRQIYSERFDSKMNRKREPSDPPTKRVAIERSFKNKNDHQESAGLSKTTKSIESRLETDTAKRRESEEPWKRSGPASQVVTRPLEPEDIVDAPVPSVVKVTARPRRRLALQPTSTLIMKAISEANKSLATMPQRPDSTQQTRKESGRLRALRQLERIPPEKISISIINQNALQKVDNQEDTKMKDESEAPHSPRYDETARNKSPVQEAAEVVTSKSDNVEEKEDNQEMENEVKEYEEMDSKEEPQALDTQEPVLDLQPTPDLESVDEDMDPQFVVTLNGYDPDGLFSHSELDLDLEGENDEWLKESGEQEPLLTSTPDQSVSPLLQQHTSPTVLVNGPAVNHSNLIEVDLVKNNKSAERCKFWPACRLADKCTFYHPTKPCMVFPACKFRDTCLYIHPQCKFNALCTRKDCVFAHTSAHTPQPAVVSNPKTLYAASATLPCKFYPNCANINCQFYHPSRTCRFGSYCTKKDCSFDHGQVAPVDKLKWTRVSST